MKSDRSYSDFFTSGFRAMTTRATRRRSAMPPLHPVEPELPSIPKASRRHSSFVDFAKRRSRTTSMILSPSTSFKTTSSSSSSSLFRGRRERRSSFITFSSRLFDRRSSVSGSSLSFSPPRSKNAQELLNSTEVLEVWITAGGPLVPRSHEDSIIFQPIDPFASSPDSKSFFSDETDSPAPSKRSLKDHHRTSFLSLSPSSPDRSFLHLPSIRRRERPSSISTMPLPSSLSRHNSSSRRSSYFARPSTRDSWMLEEKALEEKAIWRQSAEPVIEDDEELLESDPTQNIDWRQFHLEVLQHQA